MLSIKETSRLEQDLLRTINDALDQAEDDDNDDDEKVEDHKRDDEIIESKDHQSSVLIPSVLFDSIPRAIYPSVLNVEDGETDSFLYRDENTTMNSSHHLNRIHSNGNSFIASMNEKYSVASLEYLKKHKLLVTTEEKKRRDPVARVLDIERLESLYRKSNNPTS